MRFLRWLLAFLGIRPSVKWEDGVVVTGAELDRYRALYLQTVNWIHAVGGPIQAPTMRVTVRLYTRWPVRDGLVHYGKVLAPNVIVGDAYGTLCLYKSKKHPTDETIVHECRHCITGVSDHPDWLFPQA